MTCRRGARLALLLSALLACAGPQAPRFDVPFTGEAVPWTGLEPLEGPGDFRFVVVTDRTGEHRHGVFRDAMPKLNLLRPAFAMSVGDLIEGYTEDGDELDRQWSEVQSFIGSLDMPFFYVPGNHDMSNRVMAEAWRDRFGPSFYHFRYRDVLFLALNSELFGMVHDPRIPVPGPESQGQQLAFAREVLAANRDARWTFVFVHQPLWDRAEVPADWLQVEEWLGDRPYTVFAGHVHRYTRHLRRDRSFITLATTGGGSGLRGLVDGEFDHVALVTMTERGPVLANLLLDGIQPEDVRSEAVRAVARRLRSAIRVEPATGSGETFVSGPARFRIRNESSVSLEVGGDFSGGPDFEVTPRQAARRVDPGGEAEIQVALRAIRPVPFASATPGRARFRLRVRDPEAGPVAVETDLALLPETRFACPPGRGPVSVDGALDEWPALPFAMDQPAEVEHPELHGGSADLRVRFGVRCDDDAIYLGVEVEDDSRVASGQRTARHQDRVFVLLDPRPEPALSANTPLRDALRNGAFGELLRGDAGPVHAHPDNVTTLFLPAPPAEARSAGLPTARGYAVEFAFPTGALDERQDGAWRAFRLELRVADFDADEPGHSTLYWRPSRFGEAAVPGSGTFVRAPRAGP